MLWLLPWPDVPETRLVIKPIRVVQPNIGQQDKWRPGYSEIAAQRLAQLSLAPGGARPRLLFWPEAAVTNPMQDARPSPYGAYRRRSSGRARRATIGAGDVSPHRRDCAALRRRRAGDRRRQQRLRAWPGRAGASARYDKAHLVPYGEYLPMRPLALGDRPVAARSGRCRLHLRARAAHGRSRRTGARSASSSATRSSSRARWWTSRNRPAFIFNPSNDAWFGAWGPPQHLAQARLRAAEEGLPVIRSTPTGISALIDARGRVLN